ncbi:tetratricopeptide repeat protein [Acinetobacter sp.]|uniref:tetratricopeptide repeat protein n=1 Tax=Acinetobacter sp. TaxID=472 RepID=UPI002FCC5789
MNIKENKLLSSLLNEVQLNISEDNNYKIDKNVLKKISELSEQSNNIFWHDVAIDYMKVKNIKYIECLEKIINLNDTSYMSACRILGRKYLEDGDLNKAFDILNSVINVDEEIYFNARIDLAIVLEKQGNPEGAIKTYSDIIKQTNKNDEEYAKAQQNLAGLYMKRKMYEQAEQCLNKILSKHGICYADAQFGLGIIYSFRGDDIKALIFYQNVDKIYLETYSKAKFNEGNIYHGLNEYALAKSSYMEILESEHDLYSKARYLIGSIYLREGKIGEASEFWKQISRDTEVYSGFGYQIKHTLDVNRIVDQAHQDSYLYILNRVQETLKYLIITSDIESDIAHYTNITVSKLLLSTDEKSEGARLKSPLRLNTIDLMNDPEEGLLLNKLLYLDEKISTPDLAFISCFTLHHDSLNQFRLYGKESQQEATGLSLVLSKEFFAKEHNILNMLSRLDSRKSAIAEQQEVNQNAKKCDKKELSKRSLFRCIYLDPASGLIKVAQREEWSFHREHKAENKKHILEPNPEAKKLWKEYQEEISKIEFEVSKGLIALIDQIKMLNQSKLNPDEQKLLAEIILPLRYLIKHMAFKEEQECRMIYVTQMDNELIQYDEKINRIYIDYEPSIMEHLKKIYLAPKASGEKMVFEYLCSRGKEVRKGKASVKVKISQNPFR